MLLAAAIVGAPCEATADPVLTLPAVGKGRLGGSEDRPGPVGIVAEVSAIAVLGTERETTFPHVGDLEGNQPELAMARVGLIADRPAWPVKLAARFDLAEATRVTEAEFRDHPFAVTDRFVDDLYAVWTPRVWASAIVGRHKVPFSKFRQLEEGLLTAVAPPFVIDRIAPDRRWGATLLGDLGALSYAAGGYEDVDALEPRPVVDDPSADAGRAALAAHIEWTPRAPIGASHIATGRGDPWYDTLKLSGGAGVLYRLLDGRDRVDGALSGLAKWKFTSALVELLLSYDGEQIALTSAGEVSLVLIDRAAVFARADYDVEVDLWSAGGGASWFVTKDRLNKIVFLAFARRDTERGPRRDGVIIQLQGSL